MPSFEKHARTVTVFTLVSRVTGLLRDAVLSRLFGAGPLMSAFFFAFMIPNLFRRLFGEGALAAAFLPGYSKLIREDPQLARAYATLTIAWLVVILGGITLLGEVALLITLTIGNESNLAIRLMMVMLPYMPLVCIVAILGAMLQVHGRFGPTAAAPIVLNLCIVMTAIVLAGGFHVAAEADRAHHTMVIAIAVVVAGVIQVVWSVLALGEHRRLTSRVAPARPHVLQMFRLAGPMILSLGVLQLNTFFDGLIASYPVTFNTDTIFGVDYPLDQDSMAVLSFAQRLYQFPLGVFGIAVATAIFPQLAREAADGRQFLATLQRGLRLVIFIGLPASVGLILVREPLVRTVFEGGEFGGEATRRVGLVLLGYAPAIWAYSMTHTLTRAFYALGDSVRPMRIALAMVALNIVLNLSLIWSLGEAGLAWSTAICSIIQALILLILLRRQIGTVVDRQVASSWLRTAGLTAVMAAGVLGAGVMLASSESWARALMTLAIMTACGAVVIGGGAAVLKMPELRWAMGRS